MWILYTLILFLAVVLNSIELSSQLDGSPDDEPITYVPQSGPSSSRSPARSLSPAEPQRSHRARSRSHRARSTSPRARNSPQLLLGFTVEELRFVRLIPKTNPDRKFEIRGYTFPRDKPIYLKGFRKIILPIPTEEVNVLSTSDGDIFAIVSINGITNMLRGIYTTTRIDTSLRAKINMHSGKVELMSPEEVKETPSGTRKPISKIFRIVYVN